MSAKPDPTAAAHAADRQSTAETQPWRKDPQAFEAVFIAWIESGEQAAQLARDLINGRSPLSDAQARVAIARLAFFSGRQDGVAFAQGSETRWAQADNQVPA